MGSGIVGCGFRVVGVGPWALGYGVHGFEAFGVRFGSLGACAWGCHQHSHCKK